MIAGDGALTYAELDEAANRLAYGLSELGLAPGDRVVTQLTNRLHTVVAWYGMLKAGLIPVCTLAAHRGYEIGSISRRVDAAAHLVEATPSGFDLVAFAMEQQAGHPTMRHVLTVGAPAGAPGNAIEQLINDADPVLAKERVTALRRHRSRRNRLFPALRGTTGVPKIIPRLHAEYWYNARAFAEMSGWDQELGPRTSSR